MRRIIVTVMASLCACVILSSCGPVYIGSAARQAAQNKANAEAAAAASSSTDSASTNTAATNAAATNAAATNTAASSDTSASTDAGVNCDEFMQQLAGSCFKAMAFEADGTTPLHMKDEAGNDVGEVDQNWAKSYCECYAQMAFQKFGCTTVVSHEKLDDATYASIYAEVEAACYELSKSQSAN